MTTRTTRSIRRAAAAASLFALAAAVIAAAPPASQSNDATRPASASPHETPLTSAAPIRRALPAITKPGRDVTLAAPLDGVLLSVFVEEGQHVRAGDLLARMDNRVAAAAVALAEVEAASTAAIDRAAHDAAFYAKQLERLERSAASHAATEHELDEARNMLDRARATLAEARERQAAAQARLERDRAALAEHDIRAPFDAVVYSTDSEPGAALNLAEPIVRLVALDTLEADLHLPATLLHAMHAGDRITLLADSPVEGELNATVLAAVPVIDPASRTVRCRIRIDNPKLTLPAGFIVRLTDREHERLANIAKVRRAVANARADAPDNDVPPDAPH